MNIPKISVIVPIYNNEKYLPETIKCLSNQSYKNLEIILIDDGSTDNTLSICKKAKEENSNIILIHQENSGVSAARNAGLKVATGELIGFCDGDDTIPEDYYEFLYNQMIRNNSDIACCGVKVIRGNKTFSLKGLDSECLWEKEQYFSALFRGEISVGVYDKLFKKEVLENIEFSQKYKINEDKYFCFLAGMNAEKISFENVLKYCYYIRQGSSSRANFTEKYFDALKIAQEILVILKEKFPCLVEQGKGNVVVGILILYKQMCRTNALKKYPEYENKIYDYIKSFDRKIAKNNLKRNDYIRFNLLRFNKKLFVVLTKLFDKN